MWKVSEFGGIYISLGLSVSLLLVSEEYGGELCGSHSAGWSPSLAALEEALQYYHRNAPNESYLPVESPPTWIDLLWLLGH